ncbi:NACHT domain-containing protein [Streptomyces sp. NPDC056244]|uniref:NACHT domain-containing protein n=1 Tax=Streptomyces sp. NPDC056244 TaxID=3345762 RepID=UPI0035E22C90
MVLGAPGSGKTALTRRFALDWLRYRAPHDPIPVIFSLGSWDPATTTLRDWMCDQLARDRLSLALGNRDAVRRSLAGALVDTGLVLPLLDGFDEIASGLHGAALRALNLTTTPLLLTSRPAEYSRAVLDTPVLAGAAVIELKGLTVDDYAGYLRRAGRPVRDGGEEGSAWKPVLDKLREEPRGPDAARLAEVLSTPLMVSLAGTVYRGAPGHDPSELLRTARSASPEALEARLLAAFVPAVYDPTPTGRETGGLRRREPERAEHWLSYLAAHLDELSTHDLAWWELGTTMRHSSRMLVVGFLAALAFGMTTAIGNVLVDLVGTAHGPGFAIARGLIVGLLHGLVIGLAFGLLYGYVSRTAPHEPSRVRVRGFGRSGRTRTKFVPRFLVGLGLGLPAAVMLVLLDRFVVAPLGFDDGLDGGTMGAILFPLEIGLGAGLVLVIMALLETPIDIRRAVSAWGLLTANRNNAFLHTLVWMIVFGVPAGLLIGFVSEPVRGLVFGIEAAFGGGLGYGLSFTAWGQWVALSRVWLPLTGRLPWAVITFLDDARQRGVLRQSGAFYQFRYPELQYHLVEQYRRRLYQAPQNEEAAKGNKMAFPKRMPFWVILTAVIGLLLLLSWAGTRDILEKLQNHGALRPSDAPIVVTTIVALATAVGALTGGILTGISKYVQARGQADAERTRANADMVRAEADMFRARNGLPQPESPPNGEISPPSQPDPSD